jgi:hypothetical protein
VISAYEAGRRQPSLPALAGLIDAAGYDLVVDIQHWATLLLPGPVWREPDQVRRLLARRSARLACLGSNWGLDSRFDYGYGIRVEPACNV